MPPVVAAIATAASAAAADAAAAAGASFVTVHVVSTAVYAVTQFAVTAGALFGLAAASQPKLPSPQALQTPLKQSMPVRQSAFGRVRVSGAYMFFGTGTGTATALSIDILALLDGRSEQIVSFYLNDDLMAPVGDYWWAPGAPGKYGGGGSNPPNLVQIDSRLGLTPEASYSEIEPALPLWDANHRGDGITSMALYCKPAKREDQAGDFPNGVPTPSAVIDAQLVFDPRDGTQTQGDKSTYKFSDNPVLILLAYLTDAEGGMGLDYARFIEPAIDYWKAAADECDGLVNVSGMHATLADAAAVGDHKIFLADTTGLTVGATINLPTEDVVVSALPGVGEVDITAALLYAHTDGELANWSAAGTQARYRCAGTYKHDAPPGDVIKSILATFDGWIGQRGDGALVVRTNTVYEPSVVLTDRHILGYTVQDFLPDEQATNQFIVSYTDPASAFNKVEAGYVQDDADILARGQLRSSELYLQWCPSGPQAIAVARPILARSTQPLRGNLICNLAGLAVGGERYVRVQIGEFPALNDAIIEVTGKLTDDPSNLQVSFPWVYASAYSGGGPQAICFVVDSSGSTDDPLPRVKGGLLNALSLIGATFGTSLDVAVVAGGNSGTFTSIVKRSASAADLADIATFVEAIAYQAGGIPTANGFDAEAAFDEAKSAFFDGTDGSIVRRRMVLLWDGVSDPGGIDSDHAALIAHAEAAAAVLASMPGVLCNCINNTVDTPLDYAEIIDNTPDDGIPEVTTADAVLAAIERAVFGTSSTPGAGYTLPPLAPPSGAALQPLAAPTIISVTPDYADSGGGVSGARLSIEVDDPGFDATWKVQWKLSADTVWTNAGDVAEASGTPLTLLTGLVVASGPVDVEVAYVTASQVSPWSATTTATVAATPGGVASTSASASFATTSAHNCYYVDTAGAAYTVTLNATPAQDEVVEIWDATGHAAANPISFAGNGHNIAGVANVANFIQINFGRARLIFDGTQWLMQ